MISLSRPPSMVGGQSSLRPTTPSSFAYRFVIGITILLLFSAQFSLRAADLPSGFTETLITSGLSSPTAMAMAPDGRIFVCQQNGGLRVIKNGSLLTTPFLTLNVSSSGERG